MKMAFATFVLSLTHEDMAHFLCLLHLRLTQNLEFDTKLLRTCKAARFHCLLRNAFLYKIRFFLFQEQT